MDFGFYRTIKQLVMSNGLHSFVVFQRTRLSLSGRLLANFGNAWWRNGWKKLSRNPIGFSSEVFVIPYSSGLIFKFSWNGDLKVGLEAHVMFVKRFFSFYPMARSNSFYEKKWFPFLPWSRAAWKCSLKLRGGSLASLNTGTRLIAHK